ncbi:MAG: SRPBCC family protein [Myxococcota bacterium]
MTRITVQRTIAAPPETIFAAVSDVHTLPSRDPAVKRIEFLTETESGVGTRFRETRVHKGKEMVTELEVTEYSTNDRVRMVADSHGTVWDTTFEVKPAGDSAELIVTMDARAHKLMPRLLNPLLKGMFRKGLETYMDTVKTHCEKPQPQTSPIAASPSDGRAGIGAAAK